MSDAAIGVIGGSGLYHLFQDGRMETPVIETPFGPPSGHISISTVGDRRVAFLARHGENHSLPPHRIPYRANIWALGSLGVKAIVTSSAVGGLSAQAPPGIFVLPNQLIDRTHGRRDTFYDNMDVQHLAAAEPFDPELRSIASGALKALGETFLSEGTTVVIQGPRFSTKAEAQWFRAAGADIVNMTQYPEAVLAAELNIGLITLSFVTDTDTGTASGDAVDAADADKVLERMRQGAPRIRQAIEAIVTAIPQTYSAPLHIDPTSVTRVLALRAASMGAA